jgi:hypothetical protein
MAATMAEPVLAVLQKTRGTSYIAPVKRGSEKILSFVKTTNYKTILILGTLLPENSFTNSHSNRRISRQ